jgi:hypothetical protein
VILRVGTGSASQEFAVHEAVLRKDSPFFRKALEKNWREGETRRVELPHDDSEVVAAYVDWLYFGKVASKPLAPPALPLDDGEYHFLARLYSFGDKVQADTFCDSALDAMVAKTDDVADDGTRTFPSHSAVMALYNGTPSDSPARRFVVDMYLDFGAEKWIPEDSECNHVKFLTDLSRAFLARSAGLPRQRQKNYPHRCRWHKMLDCDEFLLRAESEDSLGSWI